MQYDEIKSLLLSIDDPVLKLETLMDIGKTLAPIPEGKTGTEVKGCASRVEIYKGEDGQLYGTADSALVRGIIAILLAMKAANAGGVRDPFSEFPTLGLNLGAARLTGAAAVIEYLKNL